MLLGKKKETHPQVVMCRPTRCQHAKPQVAGVLSDRATHASEERYIQHYCEHGILPHHLRTGKGVNLNVPRMSA